MREYWYCPSCNQSEREVGDLKSVRQLTGPAMCAGCIKNALMVIRGELRKKATEPQDVRTMLELALAMLRIEEMTPDVRAALKRALAMIGDG